MRIMGIDYGDARVGLAVSDALGLTAQGIGVIKNRGMENTVREVAAVIEEYGIDEVVIGLPRNMDGSEGFRAEITREFAGELEGVFRGEICLRDERLTTVEASRLLNETNTRGKKRKKVIDTVAACLILEGYLAEKQKRE